MNPNNPPTRGRRKKNPCGSPTAPKPSVIPAIVIPATVIDVPALFSEVDKIINKSQLLTTSENFYVYVQEQLQKLPSFSSSVFKGERELVDIIEDFTPPVGPDIPPTTDVVVVQEENVQEAAPSPDEQLLLATQQQLFATQQQLSALMESQQNMQQEIQQYKDQLTASQARITELLERNAPRKRQLQSEEIKNAIVELILKSDLNIESIPDSIERELYNFIIDQITVSTGIIASLKRLCTCSGR